MKHIIREHFNSISQMLSVVESRPNNDVMANCDSSHSGDKSFTGTSSYDEAKNLFQYGYTDVLERIKTGLAKADKAQMNQQKRRVSNGVVGYAPNVPNAILGLPNSMIFTEKQVQKVKVISIVYSITENCCTEANEFVDSGVAVLNVVNTLEKRGVRVNLKIMFYNAQEDDEYAFGTVSVKDYREHLDIQKLCFPIANPSMFRRFGFRWFETVPGVQNSGWEFGYGHPVRENDKTLKAEIKENEYFLNLSITKKFKYDADEIIKNLNI